MVILRVIEFFHISGHVSWRLLEAGVHVSVICRQCVYVMEYDTVYTKLLSLFKPYVHHRGFVKNRWQPL